MNLQKQRNLAEEKLWRKKNQPILRRMYNKAVEKYNKNINPDHEFSLLKIK